MSIPLEVVDLSRLQFALTAMIHFLFVPLTMGLALLLAIMETVYVMTGKRIWQEMTQYWGILFGINFAMGVATGLTLSFQFGTNWAYYAHYVGDIFGAPLAIEGLAAFFLEATFIGLFFFGWDRLSKLGHLIVTWLVAAGTNLSALWILVANAWMQNPVGSVFDFNTMRMEILSFAQVFFNPVAQAKVVHTVSAAYVTGAIFVLAISAYFLLRKRNVEFAKRSIVVAAAFGLASALSVVVLGDESGYVTTQNQKMKLAAIEGMWETEQAPAGLTLIGFPDEERKATRSIVEIPFVLGIIATRSLDQEILGIKDLVEIARERIVRGMVAYEALERLRVDPKDTDAEKVLREHEKDLGYALLLKKYTTDPTAATPEQIEQAAWDTVPNVSVLFWAFRIMVGCGLFFIALFAWAFYLSLRQKFDNRWFLYLALLSFPLPWIASELGWLVAEYGRQPWVIEGVLPTFLGVSSISATSVWISMSSLLVFYILLTVVEVFLMVKYIRLGPDGLTAKSQAL